MDLNPVLVIVCGAVCALALVGMGNALRHAMKKLDNVIDTLSDLLADAVSQNLMMKSGESELDRLKLQARGERAMMEVRGTKGPDELADELEKALENVAPGESLIEKPQKPVRTGE